VEERWKQLFPSYWRDNNGDWKIAFFDDCAIYDCKFWNYKQRDVNQKTGEATILMTNGNDELKVMVGKDKKGTRTIQIGSEKATYAMITTRFLPDYPKKDTRTDFVDTGYKKDTVTVVGWIKDMPEQFKQLKTFDFGYENIYTDKQVDVHADLDEQGRFTVKFPLLNSTEFFIDWRRCFIRTMFEPGKTYFILYDFREGRRYLMGDDCRLQNELFKYPLDWKSIRMEDSDKERQRVGDDKSGIFDRVLSSTNSARSTPRSPPASTPSERAIRCGSRHATSGSHVSEVPTSNSLTMPANMPTTTSGRRWRNPTPCTVVSAVSCATI